MTTKLFFLAQVCHDYEQAMALSEEMQKSPEWSDWNLWDLSQAETFIPDEMRFPMLEDKSLLTGFSRSYYILKHKNKCYGIPRHIKEFDISNLSGNKNSNFAVSKNLAEMKANIKENILRTNAIIKEMTPE